MSLQLRRRPNSLRHPSSSPRASSGSRHDRSVTSVGVPAPPPLSLQSRVGTEEAVAGVLVTAFQHASTMTQAALQSTSASPRAKPAVRAFGPNSVFRAANILNVGASMDSATPSGDAPAASSSDGNGSLSVAQLNVNQKNLLELRVSSLRIFHRALASSRPSFRCSGSCSGYQGSHQRCSQIPRT